MTLDGNIEYAKYLFRKNGVRDWNASRNCWGSKVASVSPSRGPSGGDGVHQLPVKVPGPVTTPRGLVPAPANVIVPTLPTL